MLEHDPSAPDREVLEALMLAIADAVAGLEEPVNSIRALRPLAAGVRRALAGRGYDITRGDGAPDRDSDIGVGDTVTITATVYDVPDWTAGDDETGVTVVLDIPDGRRELVTLPVGATYAGGPVAVTARGDGTAPKLDRDPVAASTGGAS